MVTILSGGTIISMDSDRNIYSDGVIVWEDDRILWLGPSCEAPAYPARATIINAKGKIILPGFVNTHTHAALSILRGVADDRGVAPAYSSHLPQGAFLTHQDCYIFSMLGGLEALKFGTTCIVDNYIHEDAAARAFSELGMRAVVSERLHDVDLLNIPNGIYNFKPELGEHLLEKNLALVDNWNGSFHGRITCRLGPHAADTCSEAYLEKVRGAAQDKGVGVVTHLSQSKREVEEINKRSHLSPTQYLARAGLLGERTIAGHCIFVSSEDILLLADSGTQISHLSCSNAKGGMIAPIRAFLDQGVNVGLGTDNMSGDMIAVIRMAICAARMRDSDPQALNALDVLEMATRNGARAIGMQEEIGSLEVGKKADLVVMDFQKPHLTPMIDPVANLVFNGLGGDVDSVIVDGNLLVQNGKVKTIDEILLLKEVQMRAEALWERASHT